MLPIPPLSFKSQSISFREFSIKDWLGKDVLRWERGSKEYIIVPGERRGMYGDMVLGVGYLKPGEGRGIDWGSRKERKKGKGGGD